jgi:hypothetical protein
LTEKRKTNVSNPRIGPSLKSLEFSPDRNPLLEPGQVAIKRRYVSTGLRRDLVDASTGEVTAAAVIRQVEEKDDAEFVKVFADGVKATFGLSRTASRVFTLVLEQYQREPMVGGYADSVYLAWFGEGLSGRDVGMSDRTFQTGLRELLAKGFLAPRTPNVFWVNSSLFFKGDRVLFVKEYVRRRASADEITRAELEARGQQRLDA